MIIRCFFILIACFGVLRALPIEYNKIVLDSKTAAHILEVDPHHYRIISKRSDHPNGREHVIKMVQKEEALAGINGGYFKKEGIPAGILKSEGEWYGLPVKKRGAIGWDSLTGKALIDQLLTDTKTDIDDIPNLITVLPQSLPNYTRSQQWDNFDNIVGGAIVLVRNGKVIDDYTI